MVAVLRFIGNILLAVLVIILVVTILLVGYGAVMVSVWENASPEEGALGGAWVEIDGQKIYYQDVGPKEGTTVLLIHGLGVEGLQAWGDSEAALVRSGLRVIAADLPGFGYSERDGSNGANVSEQAQLLGKLLDNLGVGEVTPVSHGWGGVVALRLAEERPDVVSRIVLIAPWLAQSPKISPALLKVPYVSRGAMWVTASGGPIWEALRRVGFQNVAALNADLLASMRGPTHVRGTADTLLATFRARPQGLTDIDATQARVPMLVIVGAQDRYVSADDAKELAKKFPSAKLVTIEDAGHYVHIEQGLAVSREVTDFCLGGNP